MSLHLGLSLGLQSHRPLGASAPAPEAYPSGAVAGWPLGEASGVRYDAFSINHLTAFNAPGSAAGKLGDCATFVAASGQALYRANTVDLSMGDYDWHGVGWAYLTDLSGVHGLIGNWFGTPEWLVYYNGTAFSFAINNGGPVFATWGSAPALNTWYCLQWGYDAAANEMWLQVDDGELVVVSCSAGPVAGNNQFEIGSYAGAGSPHDGRLDDPVLFKATCTPERRAYLYNDGAGRAIPTLTGPALACLGDSKTLGAGDSQFRRGYIQALRSLIDGRIVGVLPASAPAQTGTLLSEFPAWAATVTHPPDKVLLNVGTNDFDGIPGNESVWQGLMQDILDAIWGLWPAALVYIAIPWKRDFDAVSDTVAGIVAALLADNPSLVRYGIDERIVLKHNDNGASRTSDGVHPTDACYVNIYAPAWEEAITA